MRRALGTIITLVALAALSGLFWLLYDERYAKHQDCIDALINSSCLTPGGDNLTAGGMVWGLLALCCMALLVLYGGVVIIRAWRHRLN